MPQNSEPKPSTARGVATSPRRAIAWIWQHKLTAVALGILSFLAAYLLPKLLDDSEPVKWIQGLGLIDRLWAALIWLWLGQVPLYTVWVSLAVIYVFRWLMMRGAARDLSPVQLFLLETIGKSGGVTDWDLAALIMGMQREEIRFELEQLKEQDLIEWTDTDRVWINIHLTREGRSFVVKQRLLRQEPETDGSRESLPPPPEGGEWK